MMAGWPGCWAGLGRTEGQGAEFWLTRGGAVVVAGGGGGQKIASFMLI